MKDKGQWPSLGCDGSSPAVFPYHAGLRWGGSRSIWI
jgi:hypothetical protein